MYIEVNGEKREIPDETTLQQLVERILAFAPERLAIELNREVAPRTRWSNTKLREGDRIEIVHFVGGGENEG
ncbi:MAG: sulfur carrier protein ThiS [Pyrinomonadaceae bacterium]|nr:sulfur carrier protein ThiS [Pyrinomonadaceae bacterium]